jgi:hypothetical protein
MTNTRIQSQIRNGKKNKPAHTAEARRSSVYFQTLNFRGDGSAPSADP